MTQENLGQNPPEETPAPPQRNVFLARNAKPVTVKGVVNIGGHGQVTLPDEAAQRAGFHLEPEDLALLLAQYPGIYKPALLYTKGTTVVSPEYLASIEEARKAEQTASEAQTEGGVAEDNKQEGQ